MTDFKNKNEGELAKDLSDKREALRVFRFGISGAKVRNIRTGRALRRDIARIITEVRARKV